MKRLFATFVLASAAAAGCAQIVPGTLSFSLPEHAGSLSLDQGGFKITEMSAKPNGNELGIRAVDGDLRFLGFLFVWPEKPHMTAESCRDEMLKSEGAGSTATSDRLSMKSAQGAEIALVLMIPASGKSSSIRAFTASGDLCADLSFTESRPIAEGPAPMQKIKAILSTVTFDPNYKPTFKGTLLYATVEWDKHQLQGAASAYRDALKLVDMSDDPLKWRRVITDQLSMSLGMAGDLQQSRAVNEAAIAKDSSYPMYYYNLACADAEAGDAKAARIHLQQAYDRRANVLAGEEFPDPAKDDSIRKLRSDNDFWKFVQTLH